VTRRFTVSRALIFGTVSAHRLAVLRPIGFVCGEPVFPLRGSDSGDDTGDSGDGDDSDDDSDDDAGDDANSEGDDKPAAKGKGTQNVEETALVRTLRKQVRANEQKIRAFEKAKRETELAGKSEVERTSAERDDAAGRAERAEIALRSSNLKLAIIMASNNAGYDWIDLEDVLGDRKLMDAIEVDDDGEVSGVTEALKDLKKRKPHFLKVEKPDDGNGKTGKTGANFNGGANNNDRGADRQRMEQKWSVLANMQPGAID
jgi:hypothetical protein